MKKLLRLLIASQINHPESYYQSSIKGKGIDYTDMSLNEIAVWIATCKLIEADVLIELAFTLSKTKLKDIDITKLTNETHERPNH